MATLIFTILLQSLWLGLFLAAAASIIMLSTRPDQPTLRYKLLTRSLLLFSITIGALAVILVSSVINNAAQCINITGTVTPQVRPVVAVGMFTTNLDRYVTGVDQYASYIVWIWMLVVAGKILYMCAGLHKINYIRKNEVYNVGKRWQDRLDTLAVQMGIERKVKIMQSGFAKVPVVIGYLKPLILMPVGLINNLPVCEVEAILCHELAHIKRKDYLINLLQSVIGALFFFNPAVIWINRLIRKERENCCDDMALATHVDIQDYVRALVSCGEFQMNEGNYAMAFAGNKKTLMLRVKRIIKKEEHGAGTAQKLLLALLVFGALIAAVACSSSDGQGIRTTSICIDSAGMKKEIIVTVRNPLPGKNTVAQSPEEDEKTVTQEAESVEQPETPASIAHPQTIAPISPVAPVAKAAPVATVAEETFTNCDGDRMNAELRTDGIISTTTNTMYELDDHKLVVNNIRQPQAIHKKYFEKYLKYNGRSVCYHATEKTSNY